MDGAQIGSKRVGAGFAASSASTGAARNRLGHVLDFLKELNGIVWLGSGHQRTPARRTTPFRTNGADNKRNFATWVHGVLHQMGREHLILRFLSVPNPTRVANATSIVVLDGCCSGG